MICRLGEVEVWVRNAFWKGPSTSVEILVPDEDHRALPQADIDLCVEFVW